jgi:hypothetical protein
MIVKLHSLELAWKMNDFLLIYYDLNVAPSLVYLCKPKKREESVDSVPIPRTHLPSKIL